VKEGEPDTKRFKRKGVGIWEEKKRKEVGKLKSF